MARKLSEPQKVWLRLLAKIPWAVHYGSDNSLRSLIKRGLVELQSDNRYHLTEVGLERLEDDTTRSIED